MECRWAGETEVLGENLPQRHFCPSQIPTWPDQGLNPGRRGGKPATNRLSYGAADLFLLGVLYVVSARSIYVDMSPTDRKTVACVAPGLADAVPQTDHRQAMQFLQLLM
jgi:hypothetical protein